MEGYQTNGQNKNIIWKVEKGSIAEELGILPGEALLAVNGKPIEDVFDYRYQIQDTYVELTLLAVDGVSYIAEIDKEFDEDIGILFESGLMDEAKRCANRCIFCFIDQLPSGMRETLYFKDDDSRLSFLQGNYVTLTNMKQEDLDRIIQYHLSPINISVHTTDPALRVMMLRNQNAGRIVELMERFAENRMEMHLQVVLCKGINDQEKLEQTIFDCSRFIPYAKSMSVVPIGLTKYRQNLYKMEPFTKEDARAVLCQIQKWQKKLYQETGTRFVYAADEFYLKAEWEVPPVEAYEEFWQYENGVGMLASLRQEFFSALSQAPLQQKGQKKISLATGKAAYSLIHSLCAALMERCPGLKLQVYAIENEFFGSQITVSGLLCGRDIIKQLQAEALGEYLILPDSLLRNGEDILLDDVHLTEIADSLKTPVRIAKNTGESLLETILDTEEQYL